MPGRKGPGGANGEGLECKLASENGEITAGIGQTEVINAGREGYSSSSGGIENWRGWRAAHGTTTAGRWFVWGPVEGGRLRRQMLALPAQCVDQSENGTLGPEERIWMVAWGM
jgi:hypothetical protein